MREVTAREEDWCDENLNEARHNACERKSHANLRCLRKISTTNINLRRAASTYGEPKSAALNFLVAEKHESNIKGRGYEAEAGARNA